MMKIFILPPDRSEIYIPTVTKLEWETHKRGKVGSIKVTILKPNETPCQLGYFLELWNITAEKKERIAKYRIYERTLHAHDMNLIAYDQTYTFVKCKETMTIKKVAMKTIEDIYKKAVHSNETRYSELDKIRMSNHWKYISRCSEIHIDDEVKNGIFVSDLILQFAKVYHLEVEDIDYSDVPDITNFRNLITQKDFWGLPPRVTKNEAILDIITYYLNYFIGLYNRTYVFYDGGNGLCYKQQEHMHTYLYFTLNVIGEYEIKQQLPKDYFNWVEFMVQTQKYNQQGSISNQFIPYDTFKDEPRMEEVGLFHKKEILGEVTSYKEENNQKVVKTPEDLYYDRLRYYVEMNENIFVNVDTMQLKNVIGSWKVRGGSIIKVEYYPFSAQKTSRFFYVNRVTHHYQSEENHTMDLELKGVVL